MLKGRGSPSNGMYTGVARLICTKVAAEKLQLCRLPSKRTWHVLPSNPSAYLADCMTSHRIPRYCELYTAGCKINERQTRESSYSDKKGQTSEAWKCFPSATETNTRAGIWLPNTSGWKYRAWRWNGRQVASWEGEGRSAGCRHLSRREDLLGDVLHLQTLHA